MEKKITAFTTYYKCKSNTLINKDVKVEYEGKEVHVPALWDTGATNSCVSKEVIEKLDLKSIGKCEVKTPSGSSIADRFLVNINLPNDVLIENVLVNSSEIGKQGLGLIIGMDIIGLGDFSVSNANEKTTFSFRMPAQYETDYFKLLSSSQPVKKTKIQPNDMCPCGSGKKYKRCHGRKY